MPFQTTDITWDFAGRVTGNRLEYLRTAPTLESIIAEMKAFPVLCAHKTPLIDGPNDFQRADFTVALAEDTFDLFFNSANGYRSWYYRHHSAQNGPSKRWLLGLDSNQQPSG
jgi:hypothetical protein